jgi:SAM-dependent methyltransferase
MCNANGILFAALNLKVDEIKNKRILEVGSMNVNGSVRSLLESYGPKQYVGVDVAAGPGVDIVCNAAKLLDMFPKSSFDVVVSTEMLEHVLNWQSVISNLKAMAVPGGLICISTRSMGFPYHGYPFDFWRYEVEDIKNIFSDCVVEKIEKDPQKGVFAKIRKPPVFKEIALQQYPLYSIVSNTRISHIEKDQLRKFLLTRNTLNLLHVMGAKLLSRLLLLVGQKF